MKIVHISDIHINPEPILESDPIGNFRACMDHVAKHHGDADLVVISGDLTHHGQRASYERLKGMLEEWPVEPYLMIGNHDHRETFQEIFPETGKDENSYVQYTVELSEGVFIFLDTVKEGTHAGHFGTDRQAWLKAQLEDVSARGKQAYLFMHHNPIDTGVANADVIGLVDGHSFREILSKYRSSIRHIFFGHCHYILSGNVCGISMSAPRSTSHPCVPEFTGRDRVGYGPLAPTYDIVLISNDGIVVHSIDFMEEDNIIWRETETEGWIAEEVPEQG